MRKGTYKIIIKGTEDGVGVKCKGKSTKLDIMFGMVQAFKGTAKELGFAIDDLIKYFKDEEKEKTKNERKTTRKNTKKVKGEIKNLEDRVKKSEKVLNDLKGTVSKLDKNEIQRNKERYTGNVIALAYRGKDFNEMKNQAKQRDADIKRKTLGFMDITIISIVTIVICTILLLIIKLI